MEDKVDAFIRKMAESKDYLKMDSLKDGYSYKIYARNAYAGIYIEKRKGFLISRYKGTPNPYLCCEYHWDSDDIFGTVKPLEEIEECPFNDLSDDNNRQLILNYL